MEAQINNLVNSHELDVDQLRGYIADERRIAQSALETIRNHEQHIDNLNMRLTNGASELRDAQHVYNASVSQAQALSVQLSEVCQKHEEDKSTANAVFQTHIEHQREAHSAALWTAQEKLTDLNVLRAQELEKTNSENTIGLAEIARLTESLRILARDSDEYHLLSVTRDNEQQAAAAISAAKIIELNEILTSSAEEDTSGIVALQQRVQAMIHDLTNAQSANDAMDDANKELNARVLVLTDTCSAQDARAVHTNEHFKSNIAHDDSLCTELATVNRVLQTTSESLSRSNVELENR